MSVLVIEAKITYCDLDLQILNAVYVSITVPLKPHLVPSLPCVNTSNLCPISGQIYLQNISRIRIWRTSTVPVESGQSRPSLLEKVMHKEQDGVISIDWIHVQKAVKSDQI